jgi:hypothetical protein
MAGNDFQTSKTHCPKGHEYTEANTKLIKSTKPGKFKRQCRACKAEAAKQKAKDAREAREAKEKGPPAEGIPAAQV